ncbi:hypothetical protein KCW34_12750 [Staphylococcus aureus]|nr:hypothetical protein [Staphylococcus aureus]
MTKRFLLITLILVISTALIACGKKYDKEIEEVTSLEIKDRNDSSDTTFNKYEMVCQQFFRQFSCVDF